MHPTIRIVRFPKVNRAEDDYEPFSLHVALSHKQFCRKMPDTSLNWRRFVSFERAETLTQGVYFPRLPGLSFF